MMTKSETPRPLIPKRRRVWPWVAAVGVLSTGYFAHHQKREPFKLETRFVAQRVAESLNANGEVPSEMMIPAHDDIATAQMGHVYSTLDDNYGIILKKFLARYRPDYAGIAVINPDTGAVLALESFVKDPTEKMGNLALRAAFPAASVFKIVTAAAAIDQGKAVADTVISYDGAKHTLYKKNVENEKTSRWTQHVTLREAFAKSINVVFGKLGLFHIGYNGLTHYAEMFGFNRDFKSDIAVEKSRFMVDPTSSWQLVESSSGFTNRTTLSPVHGAMIASAILNGGVMPTPHIVTSVADSAGRVLYESHPKILKTVMEPQSAQQMQLLMEETIARGTSRKSFRGFHGYNVDVGGKTGSLDAELNQGRTDWFVGYASQDNKRLAIAVVTVHKKYWTIKSAMLARLFFEQAFPRETHVSRAR